MNRDWNSWKLVVIILIRFFSKNFLYVNNNVQKKIMISLLITIHTSQIYNKIDKISVKHAKLYSYTFYITTNHKWNFDFYKCYLIIL